MERQKTAPWGNKIRAQLSADLRAEFPTMKGFSPANFEYMRRFAEAWPDPTQPVNDPLANCPGVMSSSCSTSSTTPNCATSTVPRTSLTVGASPCRQHRRGKDRSRPTSRSPASLPSLPDHPRSVPARPSLSPATPRAAVRGSARRAPRRHTLRKLAPGARSWAVGSTEVESEDFCVDLFVLSPRPTSARGVR
ncbi:DUF1016 N-terminal domain-containing protein [Rhodococcus ruber]